jgi:hypothetical protein
LLIGLITYGNFVNPYDFIFLIMLLGINGGIYVPERAARHAGLTAVHRPA